MISNDELHSLAVDLSKENLLPEVVPCNFEFLHVMVEATINHLINNDFERLVQLLYRLDVPEKKLKDALAAHPANADSIIAELIIQRQIQKIQTRNRFNQDSSDIPDEEKW